MKKYIIVDIDGTICQMGDRQIHEVDKLHLDKPILPVTKFINQGIKQGLALIFLSCRNKSTLEPTKNWLKTNLAITEYAIMLKDDDDTRKDSVIKKEMLDKLLKEYKKEQIFCVFEDNESCIEMYRNQGLVTFNAKLIK